MIIICAHITAITLIPIGLMGTVRPRTRATHVWAVVGESWMGEGYRIV